jgi:lipid II:glycine glycyltransferase (peptidoglycan interpeptide bridge formation enzyme)
VLNHPRGNIFQTPEIFELFKKTGNYEPLLFSTMGENDELTGILLAVIQKEHPGMLGYFSSRTVVWGGPIIKSSNSETEKLIIGILLKELYKAVHLRTIYIQIRNLFDMSCYIDEFQKNGYRFDEHLNYIVETGKREETEKKVSKSKKRQIKKSLKSGAKIIEPSYIKQIEEFYHILKNLYKRKIKRPLPDWSFFKAFYELSRKNKVGKYFLIEYDKKIVGGIMCPIYKNTTIYEWYVCGLDGIYNGVYPSVLASWAPIDYALKKGLKCFDFMGAGKSDQYYGVREFKSKFGGRLVKFGRFERINNKTLFIIGKFGLKILKALKK